ncbi:MAG: Rpn family recombination-promoting nuclease/putative transposase [Leptospiraceae bacterium]|nr:Rpn family recombination-promoting nuclease/putative transposase [Leptospiraceae bacterium]
MASSNHHDIYVRSILSGREESIEFFRVTLPKNILKLLDLEKLEDTQESFISGNQKESKADKLYKIPLKNGKEIYIYILFEHKSYYDPNIYTQLLRYLSLIYAKQMKNMKKYQMVIPFVFYHGEDGWDLGNQFLDAFYLSKEEEIIQNFIPNFAINLYQLKPENPDFPTEILSLKLLLRILQHIRDEPERYLAALRLTMKELSLEKTKWKRVEILETILNYMDKARKDSDRYHEVEYYKEVEEEYMTYLEKIEEKGIEKGRLEKALENAQLMKARGYPILDILEITGLSETQLRENGIL